ncbi:MAG: hypothetical protein NVSMB24_19610 [Mucilaginibacter sp.]
MFINISDSKEAANKGSSSGLVHYLEKEKRFDKKNEPEYWFNGSQRNIDSYQVMRTTDSNIAKLGKADAKFFLVNISPSQKEITFLKKLLIGAVFLVNLKYNVLKPYSGIWLSLIVLFGLIGFLIEGNGQFAIETKKVEAL